MSGRRAKALRKAFRAEHGRAPKKTRWQQFPVYGYVASEWRRVKKAYLHARSGR